MSLNEESSEIQLTGQQKEAVGARNQDVLITAGPGSGKTFTLVERYVALLGQGYSPRDVAAITFTEKAAREMRNRVRRRVSRLARESASDEEMLSWRSVEGKLDAARIGTIHSLCAEILRSHPAEARLDPDFDVIEEGLSAALKAQAVEDALIWTTGHAEDSLIFEAFSPNYLSRVLRFLLDRRLDATTPLSRPDLDTLGESAILDELTAITRMEQLTEPLGSLNHLRESGLLVQDAGDNLAAQVEGLLSEWENLLQALPEGDVFGVSRALYTMRRTGLQLRYGKKGSEAKELVRGLQHFYDEHINPWIGGKDGKDPPPDETVEREFSHNLLRLGSIFSQAESFYRVALDSRYALDFDDLESKALDLLQRAEIQERWRATLKLILVDEYQDTNERQQKIVNQLRSKPGSLFVVGDARQSIYRFRGAKVAVFRQMEQQINADKGKSIELDVTFRTHPRLLGGLEDLCSAILGTEDGPEYRVPFSALRPYRKRSIERVKPPFIEIIGGLGGSANEARPVAAQVLSKRLLELMEDGQITTWDEVALLFRASSGFQFYEDAFEAAGIPFVTVAGHGFYDRPEIRDILNLLRAVADPMDDAAMAGVLRSPAFGLSDEALYFLRWRGDRESQLWKSLNQDLSALPVGDQARAERARTILQVLLPLADRLPVAQLLNELMLLTDYRAALASAHSRMWRNIDKLIADAHKSGLVSVRTFLEYVQTLRDVGAREGEAPVEEHGSVRLMTVHKAKGLEFNLVVLADASRRAHAGGQPAYLLPEIGIAVRADRTDSVSLVTRLAHHMDAREAKAEEDRLLYVALTRTREKLLISGHLTQTQTGLRSAGWLQQILEIMEVEPDDLVDKVGIWKTVTSRSGEQIGIKFETESELQSSLAELEPEWPVSKMPSLHRPLIQEDERVRDPDELADPLRDWRATGDRVHAPAAAVGFMVHEAIHRNLIPVNSETRKFLTTLALGQGLVEEGQRNRAVDGSIKLLNRLSADPRWEEVENAEERHHEVPFSMPQPSSQPPIGTIDLLYKTDQGWYLVDFKIDELHDENELKQAIEEHQKQVRRYKTALHHLLTIDVIAHLCFLDYQGGVKWVGIET